jgi:glycosyltransferase involved in cell wall biosynthesis
MPILKSILFITDSQFGYNSDLFYYSKHLLKYYNVTFLCINHNFKRINHDLNINLIEIESKNDSLKNKLNLLLKSYQLNKDNKFHFVFVLYFPLCSLLLLLIKRYNITIDIRTSYINPKSKIKEKFSNELMKLEYKVFRNRTIISDSLAKYLRLNINYKILPLGGEFVYKLKQNKDYSTFKLLYIGTFFERDIHKTIYGFKDFVDKHPHIDIKYNIIGFGTVRDIKIIDSTIRLLNLNNKVFYLGEKRYPENIAYFEESNVGISFVPCTKYYDCQPPTKTFEYLLYGLPVIATNTTENNIIINSSNGLLIKDSSVSFCEAIELLISKSYDNILIQNDSIKYSWEKIVEIYFLPLIEKFNKI